MTFSDPSPDEVEAAKTSAGGWTKAQLAQWGVPWPPPKGWKQDLVQKWIWEADESWEWPDRAEFIASDGTHYDANLILRLTGCFVSITLDPVDSDCPVSGVQASWNLHLEESEERNSFLSFVSRLRYIAGSKHGL